MALNTHLSVASWNLALNAGLDVLNGGYGSARQKLSGLGQSTAAALNYTTVAACGIGSLTQRCAARETFICGVRSTVGSLGQQSRAGIEHESAAACTVTGLGAVASTTAIDLPNRSPARAARVTYLADRQQRRESRREQQHEHRLRRRA